MGHIDYFTNQKKESLWLQLKLTGVQEEKLSKVSKHQYDSSSIFSLISLNTFS